MAAIPFSDKYYEFMSEIEEFRQREINTIKKFLKNYFLTDDFLYDYMNDNNETFVLVPAAYTLIDLGDNYQFDHIFEFDNSSLVHATFVEYKNTRNKNSHNIKIKLSLLKSIRN